MRYPSILVFGLLSAASAAFAQSPTTGSVNGLSFMAGCWATPKNAAEEYRECYTAPYAGIIQGSSQTIKDGKTTSYEFSLISEKDGKITYTPFYMGQQLSIFTLTKMDATSAQFENPENDFPKKLIYQKNADGSLTARTEGASPTDSQNQEWKMVPQGM